MILAAGASLPLSEQVIPARYPPASQSELRARLNLGLAASIPLDPALSNRMAQPGGEVVVGRAVYPRYYPAGEGEPETAKRGYAPEPRARLVFALVGPVAGTVVFYPSSAPEFFPHVADVLIYGEGQAGWTDPEIILVESQGKTAVYTR